MLKAAITRHSSGDSQLAELRCRRRSRRAWLQCQEMHHLVDALGGGVLVSGWPFSGIGLSGETDFKDGRRSCARAMSIQQWRRKGGTTARRHCEDTYFDVACKVSHLVIFLLVATKHLNELYGAVSVSHLISITRSGRSEDFFMKQHGCSKVKLQKRDWC